VILYLEEVEMASEIERMNNMRRNIVRGALIGSVIAFCVFLYPSIFSFFVNIRYRWSYLYLEGAFVLWFLTLLVFMTRYWLYKKRLRKDPSLRSAVNDERVILNWLKAYRFAFFTATGITIVWKYFESFFPYPDEALLGPNLPNGPFLVLYVAVTSLIGSFLYYNREVKDG
jgi:hypothetical protein